VPRLLVMLAAAATVAAAVAGGAGAAFPGRIDLPDGFQPEGIATSGDSFYVGSIPTGAVYRGDWKRARGRSSSRRKRADRPSA
jgi:sugar lactone lactonase YvrE